MAKYLMKKIVALDLEMTEVISKESRYSGVEATQA